MPKKKREMPEHERQVNQKQHHSSFSSDEEQAKVARELAEQKRLRKQSAKRRRAVIEDLLDGQEFDEGAWEEVEQLDEGAMRELRNAKTRKRRLRPSRSWEPEGLE